MAKRVHSMVFLTILQKKRENKTFERTEKHFLEAEHKRHELLLCSAEVWQRQNANFFSWQCFPVLALLK
jgi:hypothetical protein